MELVGWSGNPNPCAAHASTRNHSSGIPITTCTAPDATNIDKASDLDPNLWTLVVTLVMQAGVSIVMQWRCGVIVSMATTRRRRVDPGFIYSPHSLRWSLRCWVVAQVRIMIMRVERKPEIMQKDHSTSCYKQKAY